ncbi:MAG TPA: YbgC/FadM family acyl-CoA thioesterase [Chitinivibrionales bacterium]|jgi:acyl-CoA thioester hydrolase|nr:YbgC/FadM family acyl-CoA thioesterase [Chitinivibrionales bacterium]
MKPAVNHLSVRVYYEDTDCGNVVYYANYLRYMERGRTELLRSMGFELADLHKQDTQFVVAEANVKYHSSARYNDVLDVATSITEHSSVTITFRYEIADQRGVLCVSGDVKAACVDRNGKVKRIPKAIIDKLIQTREKPIS